MVTEIGGGFIIIFWAKSRHVTHSLSYKPHAGAGGGGHSAQRSAASLLARRAALAHEASRGRALVDGREHHSAVCL